MVKISIEGYIQVAGGKVWYKKSGENNRIPLVILHGGPGFPHDYLEALEDLEDEREVVFYDQLGCGKSDRPNDNNLWTIDRFVRELEEVLSFLKLDKYHILGQSWGTALAVSFALKNPSSLKSLVLADSYLSTPLWIRDVKRLEKTLPKDIQEIMKKHENEKTTDSAEYEQATKEFVKRFVTRLDNPSEALRKSIAGKNDDIYKYMWGAQESSITGNLKDFDATNKLSEIKIPVLFVCGRYDEATPESTEYYKSLIPNSEIKIFENSAHMPFLSERELFIKTIREFLNKAD